MRLIDPTGAILQAVARARRGRAANSVGRSFLVSSKKTPGLTWTALDVGGPGVAAFG